MVQPAYCKNRELVNKLELLIVYQSSMFSGICDAFLRHNKSYLKGSTGNNYKIEELVKEISDYVLSLPQDNDDIDSRVILELLKAMETIKFSSEKISTSVYHKVVDSIIFTNKAVDELKDVFGAVTDCLKQLSDLAVTGNMVIAEYIIDRAEKCNTRILDYADEHEERLIEGICQPKSSIIYLTMLDSLKDILLNIKVIGKVFLK